MGTGDADETDWFERVVLDPAGLTDENDATTAGSTVSANPDAESSHPGPAESVDPIAWVQPIRDDAGESAAVAEGASEAGSDGPLGPPTEELPVVEVGTDGGPGVASARGRGGASDDAPGDAVFDYDLVAYGDIVDTSEVSTTEMTGVWLTTELDRESPLRMDGEPIEPEELDLPPEICDRLRDWSDQWRAEWDPDRGWEPRARIGDFEALGHWLARRVKDGVGALEVTLHLPHLGHSGIETIAEPGRRRPLVVTLSSQVRGRMPVYGEFVTDAGVGSFSSEVNGRLEVWLEGVRADRDTDGRWVDSTAPADYADAAHDLADDMEAELGPDYVVDLDLWPEE